MSPIAARWALLCSSVILLGNATACSRGSRSRPVPVVIPLEVALADPVLWRDPELVPPSFAEDDFLHFYDEELDAITRRAGRNPSYQGWIDEVLDFAGVDLHYRVVVADDFRFSPFLEDVGGGVSGYELMVLDGKLLDILLEYSTFLALYELGDTRRDPVEALDEIVLLHNDFFGETTEGFVYRYWDVDLTAALLADDYFLSFVGALVYHEFGHLYLGHVLSSLRRNGDLPSVRLPDPIDEDDADLVSGMLVARAGYDLFSAQELLDIAVFSLEQRFDRDLTYWDVLSANFQFARPGGGYASLVERKDRVVLGHDRFVDRNF